MNKERNQTIKEEKTCLYLKMLGFQSQETKEGIF